MYAAHRGRHVAGHCGPVIYRVVEDVRLTAHMSKDLQ